MEVFELYGCCKKDTNNFKQISATVLMQNPTYVGILRKVAGLTHTELERIYFSKFGSRFRASNYEIRNTPVGKKVSVRLAEIFSEIFKNIDNTNFEKVVAYNKRVSPNLKSHETGNIAEMVVESLLKKNNVAFYKHARIVGRSNIAHKVDFLIGSKYAPQVIIEVKKSNELKHNSMTKTKEVVATAVDIKSKFKTVFLAFMVGSFSDDALNFLRAYCDIVVLNEGDLSKFLEGLRCKKVVNYSLKSFYRE